MDGRNSSSSKEGGEGGSSGSRKGKRATNSDPNKPRERRRGLGIAELERIRVQSEINEQYIKNIPLSQPPLSPRDGALSLDDAAMASNTLPSSLPSSHANIGAPLPYPYPYPYAYPYPYPYPYPIHPNHAVAYGVSGDMSYGQFQPTIIGPPGADEAEYYSNPSNIMPPMNAATLPLFGVPGRQEEEYADLKREEDRNQSRESTSKNPNDPEDVDLELKL